MNFKRISFLLSFFLFTQFLFPQKKKDSIIYKKINQYRNINNDSTLFYSKILKSSEDICDQMAGVTTEAYILHRQKKFSNVIAILSNLDKTIDSLSKNNIKIPCYTKRKMAIHNRLFWAYKNIENYNDAYKQVIELESLFKETNIEENPSNYRNYLGLLLNKATINEKLNMHDEAYSILKKASLEFEKPIFKLSKNNSYLKHWKSSVFNSLGNNFLTLSKKNNNKTLIDSADYYYKKAYTIAQNFTPPHKDTEIIYSFRETEILIARNEFKKALKLINNYKNISNGYHYKHREYFQKALCYHDLQQADSAIYYSYKLLNDKKEKCKRSNLITMYDILSKQYKNLKKADSAYKYSQLTLEQYDLADKNEEETFQLLYKNDYQNALKLNQELTKKSNSKNYIFSGVLLITIASISMFFLFFYKKEKKSNESLIKQIEETSTKEETTKKEYNIDSELEKKILDKIVDIDNSLVYLKPDFSISYIAEKLNTNSTYISFVFNNSKGETFKQYYTRLKIDYIKDKLNNDKIYRNYSVKALAEEIGYSNASAFSRAFKKQTGVTPSEFIKNLS